MAVAKQKQSEGLKTGVKVNSFMSGKQIKVECAACYSEEGSWACIRPAHDAYKSAHTKVTVVQDEDVVEKEVLATAIIQICNAVHKLYNSGLNRRAVIALIADDTKLGKGTIDTVLASLLNLRKTYTN
jgi:hypothetical protein